MTKFLLALSAILAIAYGAFGSSLYEGAPPYVVGMGMISMISIQAPGIMK